MSFFGFVLSSKGLLSNAENIEALLRRGIPLATKQETKRFHGLASYYRMSVPHFASISPPLTRLVLKDAALKRGEGERRAVDI